MSGRRGHMIVYRFIREIVILRNDINGVPRDASLFLHHQ